MGGRLRFPLLDPLLVPAFERARECVPLRVVERAQRLPRCVCVSCSKAFPALSMVDMERPIAQAVPGHAATVTTQKRRVFLVLVSHDPGHLGYDVAPCRVDSGRASEPWHYQLTQAPHPVFRVLAIP